MKTVDLSATVDPQSVTLHSIDELSHTGSQTLNRSLLISRARQAVYLDYLISCKSLKRAPPNLRFDGGYLLPQELTKPLIVEAEGLALTTAISHFRKKLRSLETQVRNLSIIDLSLQHSVDLNLIHAYKNKFSKRTAHLKRLDDEYFSDWPNRPKKRPSNSHPLNSGTGPSNRTLRNRRKRISYQSRQITRIATDVKSSGKVVNLTNVEISDEAFVVLSYGDGFVPTNDSYNSLQLREQLQISMVKVNNAARRMENPESTVLADEVVDTNVVPKNLSRHQTMFRHTICRDKVVSELHDEVVSFAEQFQPTTKQRKNLNRTEQRGLKELEGLVKDGKVVICRADKGGMIVLLPPEQVKSMIQEHLEKSSNYACVGMADPLTSEGEASRKYFDGWRTALERGYMSVTHGKTVIGLNYGENGKFNKSTLDLYKPGTPFFYILPKVHKFKELRNLVYGVTMPSRLVTALNRGLTVRGDKFISTNFLGPLAVDYCKDRMKDTTEFLKSMELFSSENAHFSGYIVAMDVVSLYDNLSRPLILKGLNDAIIKHRPEWSEDFIGWLLSMIEHSLDSVYAKFGSNWFRMTDCVPTGHTLSVNLADIAVFFVLLVLIYSDRDLPLDFYARFVDDGTFLWSGTLEQFHVWIVKIQEGLKEFGLEITYDITESHVYSVFLDVKYKFVDGRLITDIYHKPTDAHSYLNFNSCHPRHMFRSIVHSQALRYRRIINDDQLLREGLHKLTGYFLDCGYPRSLVEPVIDSVLSAPRCLDYRARDDTSAFLVPFMTPYGQGAQEIRTHINGVVDSVLKGAPVFIGVDKPVIRTVFTRGRSLSSLLFRQRDVTLDCGSGLSVRCTGEEESRHKRGRKCMCCPLMANSGTASINGKKFTLEGGNCKLRNVIYLFLCTVCSKGYTGKTDQPLHKRVNGHRNCESFDGDSLITDFQALKYHAEITHGGVFNDVYRVFVVKNVSNPSDLLRWELHFIDKFNTKEPFGLNIDNPMGIKFTRLNI